MKKHLFTAACLFALNAAAQTPPPAAALPEPPKTLVEPNQPQNQQDEQKRKALAIRQLTPISFGTFASERGGTITVSPTGARMRTGSVSIMDSAAAGPAEFEITGQPNEQVQIILPERITLDKSGGQLPVTGLRAAPDGEVTLDRAGRTRIKVGGTLSVGGQPSPGNYDGLFTIDVRYVH
jgi:hypothetical protein